MRKLTFLFAIAVFCCPCVAQEPISKDAAAVYKAFLASYYNGWHATVNIADRTGPFRPAFDENEIASCFKEVHISGDSSTQTHMLNESILPSGLRARFLSKEDANRSLRDPGDAIRRGEPVDDAVSRGLAQGLLTLSEVHFNNDHTTAVLSFSFHCGRLCGNGGAMLFTARRGQWGRGKQVCGGWVS